MVKKQLAEENSARGREKMKAEKRDRPNAISVRRGPWEPRGPPEDSILYNASSEAKTPTPKTFNI